MLSLKFTTNPVFVMNSDDNISCAREGYVTYVRDTYEDGKEGEEGEFIVLNFIEKDGCYAYSEFFSEGNWPDKYYNDLFDEETGLPIIDPNNENSHLPGMYDGIKLIMISGGWCEKLSDLIQTIPDHPFYEKLDAVEQAESVGIPIEIIEY